MQLRVVASSLDRLAACTQCYSAMRGSCLQYGAVWVPHGQQGTATRGVQHGGHCMCMHHEALVTIGPVKRESVKRSGT